MITTIVILTLMAIISHFTAIYKPFFFSEEKKSGNYGKKWCIKYLDFIYYQKYYTEFSSIRIGKIQLFMNDIRYGYTLFQIENGETKSICISNIGIILK